MIFNTKHFAVALFAGAIFTSSLSAMKNIVDDEEVQKIITAPRSQEQTIDGKAREIEEEKRLEQIRNLPETDNIFRKIMKSFAKLPYERPSIRFGKIFNVIDDNQIYVYAIAKNQVMYDQIKAFLKSESHQYDDQQLRKLVVDMNLDNLKSILSSMDKLLQGKPYNMEKFGQWLGVAANMLKITAGVMNSKTSDDKQ